VKFSEGNVQCPLFGPDLPPTIERQVDAFANADSSDASQQESIGIQGVCAAQFLLESPIVFRRHGSGKILRACRKVLGEDKAWLDWMALEGQVIEQPAKTEKALMAGMVTHRRSQLAKPAEPAQHVGIAAELRKSPDLGERFAKITDKVACNVLVFDNRERP
jgi:hypothetical protein